MHPLGNRAAVELDRKRAGVLLVREKPGPIRTCARIGKKHLVRRTIDEKGEIGGNTAGGVCESVGCIDAVNLKLEIVAPCGQCDTLEERKVNETIAIEALK